MSATEPSETIEAFTARVQAWAADNLTAIGSDKDVLGQRMRDMDLDPSNYIDRGRATLRLEAEAGFGGITFPKEYGGQGLTLAYARAFNAAVEGYDMSSLGHFNLTLGMNAPAMLEYGTEEQKKQYLPRMFDGTDLWIQFLSEPTGGSDLAAAITRADLDGDEWVVNGSKIWTSTADKADMGMCLVRTNWDVPKHAGLSVLIVEMNAPGLEIIPLRLVSGWTGFCQEFFTDVRLPKDHLLGDLNDGWAIATQLLVHERNVLNGGSEYYIPAGGGFARMSRMGGGRDDLLDAAVATGQGSDPHVRQLVAEAYVASKIQGQMGPRITTAMRKGLVPAAASSILKLVTSETGIRRSDISMEIIGSSAVAWKEGDARSEGVGVGFLSRQTGGLISGTTEIQRNIISERVLDLPREAAPDRGVAFNQVRTNTMPTARKG